MSDERLARPGFGMLPFLSACSTGVIAVCALKLFTSSGIPLDFLSEKAAWVLLVASVASLLVCWFKLARIQRQRRAAMPTADEVEEATSPFKTAAVIFTVLCIAVGYIPLLLKSAKVPVWPELFECSGYARYGVALGFLILGFVFESIGHRNGGATTKTSNPVEYWLWVGKFSLGSAVIAYMTT